MLVGVTWEEDRGRVPRNLGEAVRHVVGPSATRLLAIGVLRVREFRLGSPGPALRLDALSAEPGVDGALVRYADITYVINRIRSIQIESVLSIEDEY